MKKYLFIISLFVVSNVFAQVDSYQSKNKERLEEISDEIKEKVQDEDYKEAANLKKEQSIRKKLAEAYDNGADKQDIDDLKWELLGCGCTSDDEEDDMEDLKESLRSKDFVASYKKDNFVLYFDFQVANFMNTRVSDENLHAQFYGGDIDYFNGKPVNTSNHFSQNYLGMGFRIGSSFFFHDKSEVKNYRWGFDLTYLSFMVGLTNESGDGVTIPVPDMILLNFPQPGVVFSRYFDDNSGLMAKLNVGIAKSFGFDMTGMGIHLSAKYWTSHLGIGFNYQFSTSIVSEPFNAMINQVGFSIGARF